MEIKVKTIDLTLNKNEGGYFGTASTIFADRDGDAIMPSGLNSKNFSVNPVLVWNHDLKVPPIGRITKLEKTTNGIIVNFEFASRPENHPAGVEWFPDTIKHLVDTGFLKGMSVGLLPTKGRKANKKDADSFGSNTKFIVQEWELVEISLVPVPSNPLTMVGDSVIPILQRGKVMTAPKVLTVKKKISV